MKRSEAGIRTFLLDTNVFISAIKQPSKKTGTLELVIKMTGDSSIKLVGNYLLAYEMVRYAEILKSETATFLLALLISKMEIVEVLKKYRRICSRYFKTPDRADILHAATCLQIGAVLVTNDKHFHKIRDEGVIEVWDISRAFKQLVQY